MNDTTVPLFGLNGEEIGFADAPSRDDLKQYEDGRMKIHFTITNSEAMKAILDSGRHNVGMSIRTSNPKDATDGKIDSFNIVSLTDDNRDVIQSLENIEMDE